jgi:hypothetical protein
VKGVRDGVKPLASRDAPDLYTLIGEVVISLKREGMANQADEFVGKAVQLSTYDEVLDLSQDYVQFHHGGSNESAID